MMARQVNEMVICIVTSPARPLPQINLVGPDASFYLDVLESALRDRNFEVVKSTRDEKREIRTYSATIEGPIMAVTMIRPLATTNTLSLLVVPPLAVKPKARQ